MGNDGQNRKNIGKLFYKDYYEGVDFSYIFGQSSNEDDKEVKSITERNREIKEVDLEEIPNPVSYIDKNRSTDSFKATIAYPGLVTGTGLLHTSKGLKGGFNLGMHFDYTTGMPVVYGSSVKGVLRAYFKSSYQKKENKYVDDLLDEVAKTGIDIADLFEDIFNGKQRDNGKNKSYHAKSVYERDVFFDAVVTKPYNKKHLLEDDAITPHTAGPLKNPVPIAMLKIAPGCEMEFRFLLHPFKAPDGKVFNEEQKLNLFRKILARVGVGAKTNVGYGQLEIKKD